MIYLPCQHSLLDTDWQRCAHTNYKKKIIKLFYLYTIHYREYEILFNYPLLPKSYFTSIISKGNVGFLFNKLFIIPNPVIFKIFPVATEIKTWMCWFEYIVIWCGITILIWYTSGDLYSVKKEMGMLAKIYFYGLRRVGIRYLFQGNMIHCIYVHHAHDRISPSD